MIKEIRDKIVCARQCLRFSNVHANCDNEYCLNLYCPLNKEYKENNQSQETNSAKSEITAVHEKSPDTNNSTKQELNKEVLKDYPKAIILDDNPLSIACYMEEHPEVEFVSSVYPEQEVKNA